jgi:hypothetical protein
MARRVCCGIGALDSSRRMRWNRLASMQASWRIQSIHLAPKYWVMDGKRPPRGLQGIDTPHPYNGPHIQAFGVNHILIDLEIQLKKTAGKPDPLEAGVTSVPAPRSLDRAVLEPGLRPFLWKTAQARSTCVPNR